ncbi:MAG: ABC transporter substrate-binding protein [Burkholderiales bacterium]
MKPLICTAALWVAAASLSAGAAESIRVGVGHQTMCTDTYTGGIIVKELRLLEKHLPKTGKYQGAKYEIEWKDYDSGPPITNMMLANKLDFGVMGDYPLLVNGSKFQETDSLRTQLVSMTGYNLHGSGNAIVVPVKSNIFTFLDLKGKNVSTPVGSASWGMLIKAMQDAGLKPEDIDIKNQSPPVGAANIAESKIDGHADFCPWSEIMEFRGTGRKIYDGSEAAVPYLHGAVVRKDYAEKYPEVVVAFIKAIVEAGKWVEENPVRAAESLEQWTGIEKEVQYLYFSRGGHLTLDPTIKPKWVSTLKYDHEVLTKWKKAPALDVEKWIDDKYIRQAYKELSIDYEKQKTVEVDPRVKVKSLSPAEIWHSRNGLVAYSSVVEMFKAVKEAEAGHQKINSTYVYDQTTGLKIFGEVAYFSQDASGTLTAFMRKTDADAYAAKTKGKVVTYADALSAVKLAAAAPAELAKNAR